MTFQNIGSLLPPGPVSRDLGVVVSHCEKHGEYESKGMEILVGRSAGFQQWSGCTACVEEKAAATKLAEQEAAAAAESERLREQLGRTAIPARFADRTIESFVAATPGQERAKNIARYYAENFNQQAARGRGLIMSGRAGTGKSHLATGILKAILPAHVGVYVTFMGMMNMIRSTYEKGADTTERAVIEKLSSVPLLVIDEIGVQRGTEDEHLQLFGIMDARYAEKRPSILLTNQDVAGFQRFVGDRIYDRLIETCKWVTFDWDSYRQAQK